MGIANYLERDEDSTTGLRDADPPGPRPDDVPAHAVKVDGLWRVSTVFLLPDGTGVTMTSRRHCAGWWAPPTMSDEAMRMLRDCEFVKTPGGGHETVRKLETSHLHDELDRLRTHVLECLPGAVLDIQLSIRGLWMSLRLGRETAEAGIPAAELSMSLTDQVGPAVQEMIDKLSRPCDECSEER
jgi:hypothetical protein